MIKKVTMCITVLCFCLSPVLLLAQARQTLSIEECYTLTRENFPLIRKYDLIRKSSVFSLDNAARLYLPQLAFSGQASYQSQTISFSDVIPAIPGVTLPVLSKDQYKLQAEINQIVYDAGDIKNQKAVIRANEAVQEQNVEISLNALRDRVNQIYFAVILMDEQLKQNDIRKAELQSQLDKMLAALQNGTSFKSNVDQLKAELINVDMNAIDFKSAREAYLRMLSIMTGEQPDAETRFLMPGEKQIVTDINRPELKLYDLQKRLYDVEERKLQSVYKPRINAFFQGAYGRPTLNIIENQFGPWFVTGLRLNWNLGSLYSLKNNKHILHLNRQSVDVEQDIFLYNTNLALNQQNSDMLKYTALIAQDRAIIQLRESVKRSSRAQLENGVITIHEYISQLNAENTSRQSMILHTIQLRQAAYQYNHTTGNDN